MLHWFAAWRASISRLLSATARMGTARKRRTRRDLEMGIFLTVGSFEWVVYTSDLQNFLYETQCPILELDRLIF